MRPRKAATVGGVIPTGAPVSNALRSAVDDETLRAAVRDALGAIDTVHGDGTLPELPIREVSAGVPGRYWTDGKSRALEICLRRGQTTPGLVMVHEVGHLLDHQALGIPGLYATESEVNVDDFAELKAAIRRSKAFGTLSNTLQRAYIMVPDARGQRRKLKPPTGMVRYLLEEAELFGRAYAEWIAIRSMNNRLITELQVARSLPSAIYSPEYWSDEDFGPIAEAFDSLFEKRGWLVRAPVAAK